MSKKARFLALASPDPLSSLLELNTIPITTSAKAMKPITFACAVGHSPKIKTPINELPTIENQLKVE